MINKILHALFPDNNLSNFPKTSLNKKLFLLDIGARFGVGFPWSSAKSDNLNLILVEPDPEEAASLKSHHQGDILPYALWSKETELVLNINKSAGTSSIFEPNISFLRQFDDSERFDAVSKIILKTKTIDGLVDTGELTDLDFMKIDVQGAELEILKGGLNYLKNNLVGLEVEVEFSSIYEDQPLFSEVETFVRQELG